MAPEPSGVPAPSTTDSDPAPTEALTFDPQFLRRLEALAIVARKTLRGVGRGERRSKRSGGSVEFSDYRRYAVGDDTRRIDWYAYARLEQMFLKLYVAEQDLSLHVLLDVSASMGHGGAVSPGAEGDPLPSKLVHAQRIAVALAYIALAAGDRVSLRPFCGGERGPVFGPARGRGSLVRLLRFLTQERASGRTSLRAAVDAFCARRPAPGVVIVLSDLLDPDGAEAALTRLRYSGFEVHVIHLLDPAEAEPQVGEDLDLVDAETGDVVTVSLTQAAIRAYRRAFDEFLERVRELCRKHEIGYVPARTDERFEDLILEALRGNEIVR